MKMLKRCLKQMAMVLVIALLIPMLTPTVKANAEEVEKAEYYVVEMGENSYMEFEETDSVRTTVYYVNGTAVQRAVYNLETGVILYYDLSQEIQNKSSRTFDMRQQNVIEYNIDEFKVTAERENVATYNRSSSTIAQTAYAGTSAKYSYLKSQVYNFDGTDYSRSLFGYTSWDEYEEDYWYFEAKIALAVIATVLGVRYPAAAPYIELVGVVAGEIIDEIAVVDTMMKFYWKYKFCQYTPSYMEFECPYEFVYRREKKIQVNDYAGKWEVVYKKTSAEIEMERDEILESPGYYY